MRADKIQMYVWPFSMSDIYVLFTIGATEELHKTLKHLPWCILLFLADAQCCATSIGTSTINITSSSSHR